MSDGKTKQLIAPNILAAVLAASPEFDSVDVKAFSEYNSNLPMASVARLIIDALKRRMDELLKNSFQAYFVINVNELSRVIERKPNEVGYILREMGFACCPTQGSFLFAWTFEQVALLDEAFPETSGFAGARWNVIFDEAIHMLNVEEIIRNSFNKVYYRDGGVS